MDRITRYPVVEVNLDKLRHNVNTVIEWCKDAGVSVSVVVKGFNGIPEAVKLYGESDCMAIASSRFDHLETARKQGYTGQLMAIRIPGLSEVPELVRLADFSLNSELAVIEAIDKECEIQDRQHGIILMADLGDLREGYWDKEELVKTALRVENELKYVKLLGVGTNLGCYGSINATPEKMEELIGVAEMVEAAIGRKLDIISGGGSTSLPLIINGTMPKRINHLRIGEAICLARDLQELWGVDMSMLNQDVFTVKAEVVEVKVKPSHPVGEVFVDCFGKKVEYVDRGMRKRAVLALGRVDFANADLLFPRTAGIEILGASSDHLLLDVEECQSIRVGDIVEFDVAYGSLVYVTSCPYLPIEVC